MIYSALREHYTQRGGPDAAAFREEVGVWTLQGWIEDAWLAGFDVEGSKQLGGKLRGVEKWIGTTDIWAAMMFRGIPWVLYLFAMHTCGNNRAA